MTKTMNHEIFMATEAVQKAKGVTEQGGPSSSFRALEHYVEEL